MARTLATNFTSTLQFPKATAATDLFKKEDVQTLAEAVDQHTHDGAGKGLAVATLAGASIVNGSITLAKLAADSVDSSKIVDGSITSADIANGTIQTVDLAAGAVTASVVQGAFLNPTTTSTSPVAVPGLTTPTLACSGSRPIFVSVTTTIQFGSTTQNANLFLAQDAVSIGCLLIGASTAANQILPMTFVYYIAAGVAAGNHTWGLMWSTSAGTISMVGAAFSSVSATELRV